MKIINKIIVVSASLFLISCSNKTEEVKTEEAKTEE